MIDCVDGESLEVEVVKDESETEKVVCSRSLSPSPSPGVRGCRVIEDVVAVLQIEHTKERNNPGE